MRLCLELREPKQAQKWLDALDSADGEDVNARAIYLKVDQ
jgi:hypothetical protein